MDWQRWQVRFMRRLEDSDVRISVCSMARGSGKSTLLAHLARRIVDPSDSMFRAGTESIIVAASIAQSRRTTFRILRNLIDDDPDFAICDSVNLASVEHRATRTKVSVAAANGATLQGLINTPWVLADEPGSWEINSGSLSWAAVRTAQGKPGSPLRAVVVGTLSPKATYQGHWYHDLATAGSVPGVHVQVVRGDVKKWDRASEIRRCNPLMWAFAESRAILFDERDKGRVDSAARAEFQSYRLNQPTGDEATTLLPVSDWEGVLARDVPAPEGRPVIGVDLGGGRAWSATVSVWRNGRVEARAMAPGIPSIAKQEQRDRVSAGVYQKLVDSGVLTVAKGYRVPPVASVWELAKQWHGEAIICDRFRLPELLDVNTGRTPIVPRVSRWSDSSADIRGLRRLAVDGPPALAVDPLSRDLLTASLAVSKVLCDDSGNVRLVKRGAHNESRDDVAAALVLAAGAVSRIPVRKRGAHIGRI